ncbi:minor tail protein [Mycobacterium phage Aminay]|uniref:Minor tail protein n=1 Tax=Mycobacterium phage Aminay TaxID=2250291 RepID=A0A345KV10_9CAUD|nr:minor tail protein [Mycobacterium phage Aminay]AXH46862.1 hypothetical protein SEA_AMINAY_24 [Mycobacterium phage Aminay]
MAYTKEYSTIVPLQAGDDRDLALWLARESFDRQAAGDALVLVDFGHREISPDDVPPKVEKQLGRPVTDFTWIQYTGMGRRAETT